MSTIVKILRILLNLIFIMTMVAGCTASTNTEENVALYERSGITIAIPNEYTDQLLIDPVEYDDDACLIKIYHKSIYEKNNGMGYLFSIVRYTEAQYEQFLGSDGSGQSFFAKDDKYYYGFFIATDMQAPVDEYEEFKQILSAVGDYVKSDMITRNKLNAYSDAEFFNRTYTYDSEHILLDYYPYYAINGSKEVVWTLILSQPVKQGNTGIWCVERWKDQYGNTYTYFPNENGIPSREYYAGLQAECDAGRDTSWLDPKQAAIVFVKKAFEHTVTADSFHEKKQYGIMIPGSGRSLNLDIYPIDFPFGFDLIERNRRTFRAESFGNVTVVSSDGLQIKYLHNEESGYFIHHLRTTKAGYAALEVAVGDKLEVLENRFRNMKLLSKDSLLDDSEAYFGSFDKAYIYNPEDSSTISILYIVKDGYVIGIEMVNGLDGRLY